MMESYSGLSAFALSLGVIAAVMLALGGVRLIGKRQTRTRGILMLVCSVVILMNVMIWTV